MGEYSTVPVIGSQITRVQGSSIIELERNMNAVLSAIAGGRVVTAIRAAGSGQGHMFTVEIEHGVGQGYDPDDLELRCYMATGVRELGVQYTAAVARVTAGMVKVDTITIGASDDLVAGAILVYADPAHRDPTNLWLVVADWYINATTGSDENLGTTGGAPLATHAEFARRMGDNPTITHATNVYINSDLNEFLRMKCIISGTSGVYLRYYGAAVGLLGATATSSYTESAVGVEGEIVAGALDFTPYIGKQIRFTSGPASGGATFVSALNTLTGTTTGRLGIPVTFNATGAGVFVSAGVPVAPNTFVIEELPKVYGFDFEVVRPLIVSGGGAGAPGIVCERINFTGGGGTAISYIRNALLPTASRGGSVHFGVCDLPSYINAPVGVGAMFYGCTCGGGSTEFTGGAWTFAAQAGGSPQFLWGCVVDSIGQLGVAGNYFEINVTFADGATSLQACSFGVYDVVTDAISVLPSSSVWLSENWGDATGGTGYGLNCQGYVKYTTVPTITGQAAGGEVLIGAKEMDWADTPHKNCLPSQAQWTGGAAAVGDDDNDYHVIVA
jgi:hypothetical protein